MSTRTARRSSQFKPEPPPPPQSTSFSTRRSYGYPRVEYPPTESVAASCTRFFARHCWPQLSRCSGSSRCRETVVSVVHSEFPMMFQILLLLLACGLSRYVWSINTSISFTVLEIVFYIGFVVVGTASSGYSLQTQFRWLSDISKSVGLLASVQKVISTLCTTWGDTR